MIKWLLLMVSSMVLMSCTSITSNSKLDYKTTSASNQIQLEVPPDLSKFGNVNPFYAPSLDVKPTISIQQNTSGKIVRNGTLNWLEINLSTPLVWPILKEFWQKNGFTIVKEDNISGVMETDWAQNSAKLPDSFFRRWVGKVVNLDSPEQDKFRTRVESRKSDSQMITEVYITHKGYIQEALNKGDELIVWKPRNEDIDLEIEFLKKLLAYINQTDNLTVPIETKTTNLKGHLLSPDSIQYSGTVDLAWRLVGSALDRSNFTVEDKDRTQGVYYIRYLNLKELEQKTGFFSKLFTSKDKTFSPARYQIKLEQQQNNSVLISVLNNQGKSENSDSSRNIAQLLLNGLN